MKTMLRSSQILAPYLQFGVSLLWIILILCWRGSPLWFCVLLATLGIIIGILHLLLIYQRDFKPQNRLCYQRCPHCKTLTFMQMIGHAWGRCPKCQRKYWLEDR